MRIERLAINNYKNIRQADIDLAPGVNCFTGANGAGKTNLLSAIYYLSACKDYFNVPDSQNITDGEEFSIVDGHFATAAGDPMRVYCGVQRGKGKSFSLNGKEYRRLADHIGIIPLVMTTPSDTMLIHAGSEERRRALNYMISQFDRGYLANVMQYQRALESRNLTLKSARGGQGADTLSLEMYETQMSRNARVIHDTRKEFMQSFIPVFQELYAQVSGESEQVGLEYQSQLSNGDDLADLLCVSRPADLACGFTTTGTHRDDLAFSIAGRPLRRAASQGQQKTFITAFKLAHYCYSRAKTGVAPLLLLDDISDKLDAGRVRRIVDLVTDKGFGQIFVTDTDRRRLGEILSPVQGEHRFFDVAGGEVRS